VLGGSYSDYRGAHFGEVIWASYAGNTNIGDRYYNDDATKTDMNAFAKLTYKLTDRMDVFGDAQFRQVEHSYLGLNSDFASAQQTMRYSFFNPKAGLLYHLRDGAKVYASVAVGNREPNREDLQETTPESRPNSERMLDYEVGYEKRSSKWSAGVNGYFMDYSDQLVLTGELNDVGAALRTNVKSSYRAGVELMAAVQVSRWLQWRSNATFSRNKVRNLTEFVDDWDNGGQDVTTYSESDLSFSPSTIASSELSFRIWEKEAKGHAHLTLVTKYVGEQYLDNSSSAARMLDAYLVNDARVNITLLGTKGARSIDVNLTVRNVFSELYESNGWVYSYVYEGRRQEMVGLYPQAPIHVLGGVTVRF